MGSSCSRVWEEFALLVPVDVARSTMADQREFDASVWSTLEGTPPSGRQGFWSDKTADALVRKYFTRDYTGRHFERLGDRAARDSNAFTAEDFVAVTMLGVSVPARAAHEILDGSLGLRMSGLLNELPNDVDIWDAESQLLDKGGPAWDLWDLLDDLYDIGWVTANKLMARKRPRLIPVYDNVVREALEPGHDLLWERLRTCLREGDGLLDRLASIRSDVGQLEDISLLRILDVVIWMRCHGDAQVDD